LALLTGPLAVGGCAGPEAGLRRFEEGSDDQPRAILSDAQGLPAAEVAVRAVLYEPQGVRVELFVRNLAHTPLPMESVSIFLSHEALEYAPLEPANRVPAEGPAGPAEAARSVAPGEGVSFVLKYELSRPMTAVGHLEVRGLGDPDTAAEGTRLELPPRPPVRAGRKIRLYPGS
jgi:hypothetical protein